MAIVLTIIGVRKIVDQDKEITATTNATIKESINIVQKDDVGDKVDKEMNNVTVKEEKTEIKNSEKENSKAKKDNTKTKEDQKNKKGD